MSIKMLFGGSVVGLEQQERARPSLFWAILQADLFRTDMPRNLFPMSSAN